MRTLAFLDGSLADPDEAHIRVDDLGLMRGDGVFETILVAGGQPRELGPHLDRLARSAAMLELALPDRADWERGVAAVIDNWGGDQEFALKLVCSRGVDGDPRQRPTAFAMGIEIGEPIRRARVNGVAAVTLDRGIDPDLAGRAPWLLLGAKSLSYGINMAALREAGRRGAEEAVFLASDGSVLEGPTSTLMLIRDRTLFTPPAHIGILPGTTQAAVFRGAERAGWSTKVEPLRLDDLRSGDGVLLASSVRKIVRVHTLDGQALPDATEALAELTAAYEAEYA